MCVCGDVSCVQPTTQYICLCLSLVLFPLQPGSVEPPWEAELASAYLGSQFSLFGEAHTGEDNAIGLVYSRLWKLGLNLLRATELHRKLRSQGEPQKCLHISLLSFGRNNPKYSLGPYHLLAFMVLPAAFLPIRLQGV